MMRPVNLVLALWVATPREYRYKLLADWASSFGVRHSRHAPQKAPDVDDDIGQGEGCEGGKCLVRRG